MSIYTKNGSRVDIVQAFRPSQKDTEFFMMIGGFLVQAVVTQSSTSAPAKIEQSNTALLANDPVHQGWISTNELVAERGLPEILQECMGAPTGTPQNYETLLKLYWPNVFGHLTPSDFADTTFVGLGTGRTSGGAVSTIRKMAGLG